MPVHMPKKSIKVVFKKKEKKENAFEIRALLQPIFPPGCTETSYQF